jgi:hypothetical protein
LQMKASHKAKKSDCHCIECPHGSTSVANNI